MKPITIIGLSLTAVIAVVDVTSKIIDLVEEKRRRKADDILNSFIAEEFRKGYTAWKD